MEQGKKPGGDWQTVWYSENDGGRRRRWHVCWTLEQAIEHRERLEEDGQPVERIERRINGQWVPVDDTGEPVDPNTGEAWQPPDMSRVYAYLAVRDRVLDRDGWSCRHCGGPSVTVRYLPGRHPTPGVASDPNRLNPDALETVCGDFCTPTPAATPAHKYGRNHADTRRPDRGPNTASPATADERSGTARPQRPDMERHDGPRQRQRDRGRSTRPDLTRRAA